MKHVATRTNSLRKSSPRRKLDDSLLHLLLHKLMCSFMLMHVHVGVCLYVISGKVNRHSVQQREGEDFQKGENEKPEITFRNPLNLKTFSRWCLCSFHNFLCLNSVFHLFPFVAHFPLLEWCDHYICIIQQHTKSCFWFQWPAVHDRRTDERAIKPRNMTMETLFFVN